MTTPSTVFDPARFSGCAPLFPLPNTVLFPQMSLPLHLFEPRYRQMAEDALRGERLIAMALPLPDDELDLAGCPAIHEMTCLGEIAAEEKLPNGRYNIILRGLFRAVVIEEVPGDTPYRVGRLELYKDFYPRDALIDRDARRHELLLGLHRLFQHTDVRSLVTTLMQSAIPLGILCDIMAALLRTDAESKQQILDEVDVDQRSELMSMQLKRACLAAGVDAGVAASKAQFSLN